MYETKKVDSMVPAWHCFALKRNCPAARYMMYSLHGLPMHEGRGPGIVYPRLPFLSLL